MQNYLVPKKNSEEKQKKKPWDSDQESSAPSLKDERQHVKFESKKETLIIEKKYSAPIASEIKSDKNLIQKI